MRPDHDAVYGVTLREQRLEHGLLDDAVGPVLGALAPLITDDVLLIRGFA